MQKNSASIRIRGIIGRCGARDVFLGFAPANVLCESSFADVLDEDTGIGYQRPRDRAHSLDFKRYISQPASSTIPLTFNLRQELAENWSIQRADSGQATLTIRKGLPSFAQVDCQHRLGEIGDSDISLAFMAFIGLDLRSEMAMFTVINSKARGLASSLTDYHLSNLIEDLAAEAPHLLLARRLNEDPQSPWFRLIRYGGHSTSGLKRRTSLRMMQGAIRKLVVQTHFLETNSLETLYQLIVDYWNAVSFVFRDEWNNHRSHLITKGVGLYSLTKLLATILLVKPPRTFNETCFRKLLTPLKKTIDWGTHGSFTNAGGHKGANEVYVILRGELRL